MESRWSLRILKGAVIKEIVLNTEPLPSWPFGSLGDVGQINVLATRNFKIESTPESDSFFEYFKEFNVVTDITRRALSLSLLYNNEPVIEDAEVNKLSFDGSAYNLIISGDNARLIALLNNDLGALDWSAYSIGYDPTTQQNSIQNDIASTNDGLMYAYSAYAEKLNSVVSPYSRYMLPLMKLETIYNEILAQNGIASNILASVNFETQSDFLTQYIQLTGRNIDPSGQGFSLTQSPDPSSGVLPINQSHQVFYTFGVDTYFWNKKVKSFVIGADAFTSVDTLEINKSAEEVNISVNLVVSATPGGATMKLYRFRAGVEYDNLTIVPNVGAQILTFTDSLIGDFFFIAYIQTIVGGYTFSTGAVTFSFSPAELGYGENYELQYNVPELKQIEILKYIINKYALLVDYDVTTDTLLLWDYESLLDHYAAAEYIDISDKVVDAKTLKIDTSGNLAQANYLSFSNDAELSASDGRGALLLDNVNTPNSAPFYEAPFSFSRALFNSGIDTALLPYIRQTEPESNPNAFEFIDMGLRIVNIDKSSTVNSCRVNLIDFAYSIANYYGAFVDSNDDFKIITIQTTINFNDVRQMVSKSEKLPILIDYNDGKKQINGLFKLNLINRFTDKSSVELQLKKLL